MAEDGAISENLLARGFIQYIKQNSSASCFNLHINKKKLQSLGG